MVGYPHPKTIWVPMRSIHPNCIVCSQSQRRNAMRHIGKATTRNNPSMRQRMMSLHISLHWKRSWPLHKPVALAWKNNASK